MWECDWMMCVYAYAEHISASHPMTSVKDLSSPRNHDKEKNWWLHSWTSRCKPVFLIQHPFIELVKTELIWSWMRTVGLQVGLDWIQSYDKLGENLIQMRSATTPFYCLHFFIPIRFWWFIKVAWPCNIYVLNEIFDLHNCINANMKHHTDL